MAGDQDHQQGVAKALEMMKLKQLEE